MTSRAEALAAVAVIVACVVALLDGQAQRERHLATVERYERIIAMKDAEIARLLPAPPKCKEYDVHMEPWKLKHCITNLNQLDSAIVKAHGEQ